jgi:hypothetical protein
VVVEPLDHRHAVDRPRGRPRLVPHVASDALVVAHEPPLEDAEVGEDLVVGAERAVEPPVVLGADRERLREAVDEREAELVDEVADMAVSGVDELAALLRGLALAEEAAERTAASADDVGLRLVQLGVDAHAAEAVGAREAREPGADDDDLRVPVAARRAARPGEQRCAERSRANRGAAAQELAPPNGIGHPALEGRPRLGLRAGIVRLVPGEHLRGRGRGRPRERAIGPGERASLPHRG